MGSDAASCFGRIFYFATTVSQICAPDKNIAFLSEKFCFWNVSLLSSSMQLSIVAVTVIASRKDPFILTAEEKFRELVAFRIIDQFAAPRLNVLERGP